MFSLQLRIKFLCNATASPDLCADAIFRRRQLRHQGEFTVLAPSGALGDHGAQLNSILTKTLFKTRSSARIDPIVKANLTCLTQIVVEFEASSCQTSWR